MTIADLHATFDTADRAYQPVAVAYQELLGRRRTGKEALDRLQAELADPLDVSRAQVALARVGRDIEALKPQLDALAQTRATAERELLTARSDLNRIRTAEIAPLIAEVRRLMQAAYRISGEVADQQLIIRLES
jgi:hypothetical protein